MTASSIVLKAGIPADAHRQLRPDLGATRAARHLARGPAGRCRGPTIRGWVMPSMTRPAQWTCAGRPVAVGADSLGHPVPHSRRRCAARWVASVGACGWGQRRGGQAGHRASVRSPLVSGVPMRPRVGRDRKFVGRAGAGAGARRPPNTTAELASRCTISALVRAGARAPAIAGRWWCWHARVLRLRQRVWALGEVRWVDAQGPAVRRTIQVRHRLSPRQVATLIAGGRIAQLARAAS